MRDKIFHTVCFGFLFGVLTRSFVFINLYLAVLFGLLALALILFFTLISQINRGVLFAIFVLAFSFGVFRFGLADVPNPAVFESQVGKKVIFSGEIIDEPNIKENNQQLNIEIKAGKAKTEILLSSSLNEDYKYGDQINFQGILKKPENFITDQGKEFDYVNYLRKDGIFYVMSYPKIEIVSHDSGNFIKSILFSIKNKFLNEMQLAIPEPESLLMGGLILGERSSFSKDLRQKFVDTGTIHIVALSGYNVTIVAEWIMKAFSFLPRNLGFSFGILGILLFVIMAGGSSTALRAGIMASLALVARMTARTYDVGRALLLAGVVMILFNPFVARTRHC